jgi:two-component system chemotaxis response regulator CheY
MPLNVLVVDDSETVRSVIRETLGLSGLELGTVLEAGNGEEALGLLQHEWIDLILADLNMPVMNGLELVRRLHEDDVLKSVPVIMISTVGSKTSIEELRARGVRAYVRKPFTPEQIRKIVREIVEVPHESEP